jgi:hypothetical protein
MLAEGRFRTARKLLDFAVAKKKHASEQSRRTFVINRAQAYKWLGDDATARKIIGSEDWSASSDAFGLAAKVLLEEYDDAIAIMRRIGANGDPKKGDYRDWPLFSKFRKSAIFLDSFREVFGEEFYESSDTATNEQERALEVLDKLLVEFTRDWSQLSIPDISFVNRAIGGDAGGVGQLVTDVADVGVTHEGGEATTEGPSLALKPIE